MFRKLRPRSAYDVVALLGLFIALGGTSYAVTQLPANSVGTKQLKKNAVTSPKIKDAAITGADINKSKLGKVPFAAKAGNAAKLGGLNPNAFLRRNGKALDALHADSADSAQSASNANTLGGKLPTDFAPAGQLLRSGRVTALPGHTVPLINNGDYLINGECLGGSGSVQARVSFDQTISGDPNLGTRVRPFTGMAIFLDTGTATSTGNDTFAGSAFALMPSTASTLPHKALQGQADAIASAKPSNNGDGVPKCVFAVYGISG